MISIEEIKNALKKVFDPEIGFNVVELGLIYDIKINKGKVFIKMTLTSPYCPFAPMLSMQVKSVVGSLPEVKDVDIELVFEPLWNPSMATGKAKEALEGFIKK